MRLITRLYLDGQGYGTIVQELNRSPWRPRRARRWPASSVCHILQNDVYAGVISYGEDAQSEDFPALWDAPTFEAVKRERARRGRGGKAPVSPASGIVVCGRCGYHMVAVRARHDKPYRYFRCHTHSRRYLGGASCHSNYIREEVVVAELERILERAAHEGGIRPADLAQSSPTRTGLEADVAQCQRQVTAVAERQRRLALAVADGTLDAPVARQVNEELAEQLASARGALRTAVARLEALPDPEVVRAELEWLAGHWSLRQQPLEETRRHLLAAGVRVIVEDSQIVRVEIGAQA